MRRRTVTSPPLERQTERLSRWRRSFCATDLQATCRTDTMLARLVDALEDELHERRTMWLQGESLPGREAEWWSIVRLTEVLATLRVGVR